MFTDEINEFGGLDLENDYAKVKKGDYTSARNIQHLTERGNTTRAIQPIRGTSLAVTLPIISVQNKTYRVFVEAGVDIHTLDFTKTDGTALASATFAEGVTLAVTQANLQASVVAALAGATPPQVATYVDGTITATTGYVDITITTVTAYEYFISCSTLVLQITKEAIDASLAGQLRVIGSYDLLGDLFIWSTPQTELPSTLALTITDATNATPIVLTTSVAHGLSAGISIKVTGVNGNTAANGIWIATAVTPTTITLGNSVGNGAFVASPNSTIEIDLGGIGQIGVQTNDVDAGTFTYTALITTKEFNFRTKKQPHTYIEQNLVKKSLYWTDDYNPPRVLYYVGAYLTDGAINVYNPDGLYEYGSIAEETRLILSATNIQLEFLLQTNGGGAVLSGNWRYAVRFITQGSTATPASDLTNPIPVFTADTNGDPTLILGDNAGIVTPKINEIRVSGIIPGLFQFIELLGVNYVDGAITSYMITRKAITGDTMDLQHNGHETDTVPLDAAELLINSSDFTQAKSLDVIDNRMVLSNLQQQVSPDLSAWARTINYNLKNAPPTNVINVNYLPDGFDFGEYLDPFNVNRALGYTHNETYRFSVKLKFKGGGGWTQNYFVDDIIFNTAAGGQKLTGLPDFNFWDATGAFLNVSYVEFTDIDVDFIIPGTNNRIRDVFEAISFERSEVIREVLGTGALVLSERNGVTTDFYFNEQYYTGQGGYLLAGDDSRRIAAFFSPDDFLGKTDFTFVLGDTIKVLGQADHSVVGGSFPWSVAFLGNTGVLGDYNGEFNTAPATPPTAYTSYTLEDSKFIETGGSKILNNAFFGGSATAFFNDAPILGNADLYKGYALSVSARVAHTAADNTDYGIYFAQYFRAIANKYGNTNTTKYVTCGNYTLIDGNFTTATLVPVLGGDTFTQKFYLHSNYQSATNGDGFGYYSQNKVNAQLRWEDGVGSGFAIPGVATAGTNITEKTALFLTGTEQDTLYNKGYNADNGIQIHVGFDADTEQIFDLPTRIAYSELKPQNSLADNYRVFLPLNFKDLDLGFGEIMHHANGNGELITWQPRKFMRQFFNTRGTLTISDGAEVVLGSGAVMNRDGQTLTTIGTKHKWSVIKGKSAQGNDTFYWINTELKVAMRMGYDGTVVLSDIKLMRGFFDTNLTWVDDNDTPADGEGIHGVWDEQYGECIWTIRAKRIVSAWDNATTYGAGTAVSFTPSTFTTFEQTGEIYLSLQAGNTGNQPDLSPLFWQVVPHTNDTYYNEYTVVLNEFKNRFTSFYTFLPKIYLKWKDTFESPRPISNEGNIYLHNVGPYCRWYNQSGVEQIEDAHVELIFNTDQNLVKEYLALRTNSEIVPKRFDFTTKNHISFLVDTDFEEQEDGFYAPIKNDSTGTGLNDGDTSNLWGQYLRMKMTFENNVFQKLVSIALKMFPLSRIYKK